MAGLNSPPHRWRSGEEVSSVVQKAEAPPPWRENGPRGILQGRPWALIWHARELIGYLALRDVKLRYRQAVLGVVWVLAQPVASVAVLTLVFSRFAGVQSEGVAYPIFALVGMLSWLYFS